MTTRGTSNGNARGGSESRRRRREWIVETYRADVDAVGVEWIGGADLVADVAYSACRCYRCGKLLTVDTVTIDRIIPGCKGGTYRRNNIRPACGPCNSEAGGAQRGGKR